MKKKKSDFLITSFLVLILIVGLSVMLYPAFSNWWNERVSSKIVAGYQEEIEKLDEKDYTEYFEKAHEYNEKLAELSAPLSNYEEIEGYEDLLNIGGSGVMGYILVPAIGVELPVYHGTSEGVLNVAVGHLQGSSLPVGGVNTHAVLSGHRGLPSAKLFTDLDRMVVGDLFSLNVLNETFYYEVEKILVIKPDEVDKIAIIDGGDYVTLMTCTPYGINSHRLLIRSKRVYPDDDGFVKSSVLVRADAMKIDTMKVIPAVGAIIFVLLLIFWGVSEKIRKKSISPDKKYRYYKSDKK